MFPCQKFDHDEGATINFYWGWDEAWIRDMQYKKTIPEFPVFHLFVPYSKINFVQYPKISFHGNLKLKKTEKE